MPEDSDWIQRQLDQAPPLTDEAVSRIAFLLNPPLELAA